MENSSDPFVLPPLQTATPDGVRTARIRARCHAILDARRESLARTRDRRSAWKRIGVPVLVGTFCAVYFSTMIWGVLRATVS